MVDISIIMPAYNVEQYINQAISSVTNNGFKRYELIIVDDKSTDNTLKIAYEKAAQNCKIKVIATAGGNGCSYARKIGLSVAKGKYVYFCDADDYLEPGTLDFLYTKAEKYDLDVIMFNGKFKNELENEWGVSHDSLSIVSKKIKSNVISGEDLLDTMKNNKEWRYAVWLYFSKRELIDNNVDFFKKIVHEDPPFNYQLLNAAKRVKYYNVIGYNYRLRSNSLMSNEVSLKDIEGYINAYMVISNYNDKHFKNDKSKHFFEIRMLEQLEEAFGELVKYNDIKEAKSLINQLLNVAVTKKYIESEVLKRLEKEVQKYD